MTLALHPYWSNGIIYSFSKRLFSAECQANAMDCDFTCSPHPFSWEAFCDFSEDGRPHVHLTVFLSPKQIFFFRNLHALCPFQILYLQILLSFTHFQSLGSLVPSPPPTFRLFNIQNSDSNDTPTPPPKHKREEETLVIRPLCCASLPPLTHLADLILITCSYLLTPRTFVI